MSEDDEIVFNGSHVVSVSRIIVREFPALLVRVAYDGDTEPVPYLPAFHEYWGMTRPGRRVLLIKAPTDLEAVRVAFGLWLYRGFDVVATYTHAEPHRFEVKQSNHPHFPFYSTIRKDDVHAVKQDSRGHP